jgi:hypothetical protein
MEYLKVYQAHSLPKISKIISTGLALLALIVVLSTAILEHQVLRLVVLSVVRKRPVVEESQVQIHGSNI